MKGMEMKFLGQLIIFLIIGAILIFFIGTAAAKTEQGCQSFADRVWSEIKGLISFGVLKTELPYNAGC